MELVHVTFCDAAAGALKQALRLLGRRARVVAMNDNLSFGPIDPATVARRRRWIAEYWRMGDDPGMHEEIAAAWKTILSSDLTPVAWFGRRYAAEYCGFLELVSRRDVMVVDLTEVAFDGPDPYRRLGGVEPAQIARRSLFELPAELSARQLRDYRARWRRAKAENAWIRRLSAGRILGAPITYFDPIVLRTASGQWQSCGKVIEASLRALSSLPDRHRLTMFLWTRVAALAKTGALEQRGDPEDMYRWELRRPTRL